MSSSCSVCKNQSWLCERCRMEDLEARIGTPADQDVALWILEDVWHASVAFDGEAHECACGTDVETPLERSAEDLRYVPEEFDAAVCAECVDELEGPRRETVPDDATFERASKLRADGGVDVAAVREAADYWIRSTYTQAGRSIHIPSAGSTRDSPETPCRHSPKSGRWRAIALDHFGDELLEERLCGECVANALGEEYQPGGADGQCSTMPLDRLAEAGLLDEDDDRLRADGGTPASEAYRCFEPHCGETFDSLEDMEAIAGAGGRDARHFCDSCAGKIRSAVAETEPDDDLVTDGSGLEEVYWRETITEAPDGGLLIGDRELTDEIDNVCATLEALQEQADHPKVEAALSAAVSSVWQASVLERLEANTDVQMIATSGPGGTVIHGPDPAAYKRERGGR